MCTFHNTFHIVPSQGLLESPALTALGLTGSDPSPMRRPPERSPHTLLSQCGLRHRPHLGVLQDQATAKEDP